MSHLLHMLCALFIHNTHTHDQVFFARLSQVLSITAIQGSSSTLSEVLIGMYFHASTKRNDFVAPCSLQFSHSKVTGPLFSNPVVTPLRSRVPFPLIHMSSAMTILRALHSHVSFAGCTFLCFLCELFQASLGNLLSCALCPC